MNYYTKFSTNRATYNNLHIVNLSSYTLSPFELSILSKGLNFIPTPPPPSDTSLFLQSIPSYAKSLRLIHHFRNSNNSFTNIHPFKPPSTWTPPKASPDIEYYIEKITANPPTIRQKIKQNTSKQERKALKNLKNNHEIIIKKADKGSSIVITDQQTYLKEGLEHLEDPNTYLELPGDPTDMVAGKINNYINLLHSKGFIDNYTQNYLKTPDPVRTHRIYFLKKIHKNPHGIRPIVSSNGGLTSNISSFLDVLIKPLAMRTASYVKDTSHIIHLLSTLKVPSESLLVTIDVKSLYTCIPQNEGTQCCLNAINRAHITDIPIPVLETLFNLVLKCNIMRFHSRIFTQTTGTAMGTVMAPNYAILFMDHLENTFLKTQPIKPLIWKRYIDDIFMIWIGSKSQLTKFISELNEFHHNIKFTHEISDTSVVFLDLEIFKGPKFQTDNILSTKTHFKKTNTFQYLHFQSCHPRNTFKGIVKGEGIRFLRNNTEEINFTNNIKNLTRHLIYRGYPKKYIQDCLQNITFENRSKYLTPPSLSRIVSAKKKNNIPRFITTYSPYTPSLRHCLLQDWPTSVTSYMEKPQICFKKNQAIANKLVRAQLPSDPPITHSTYNPPATLCIPPLINCQNNQCETCKRMVQLTSILNKSNIKTNKTHNQTFSIKQHPITCQNTNVIYAIQCKTCSILFIGRTKSGQSLKDRHYEHLASSTIDKHKNWPIFKHYKKHQTIFKDNHILIPLQTFSNPHRLSAFENIWIKKLNTIYPRGLNLSTS